MNTSESLELVTSIERMLNRSFQGVSIANISAAITQRLSDLESAADDETTFDEDSLERGMLRAINIQLVGSPYHHTASLQLH